MKAIRMSSTGGPEVLEYVDVEPPTPGPGQVVVRTERISVNYADVMTREGNYPVMPPLPAIPGLEGSGVVEEVGEGVQGIEEGARVAFISDECYAEKVAVDGTAVISLPDAVDFDAGAAFPVTYLTAWHLLHTEGVAETGERILVYAPVGGVGTAATQLGKLAGLQVLGLTSSPEKAARGRKNGLDHVFTYDDPDLVGRVLEATGGKGVNLILDSVGGPDFPRNFDMLAPLGQVLWFGMAAGMPPAHLLEPLGEHFVRGVGVRTFHLTHSIAEPYPELLGESVGTLLGLLGEGEIQPVIGEQFPLADAARAHEHIGSRQSVGKILLVP